MKRFALFGTALSLVMALAVMVPAYGAMPTTLPPATTVHSRINQPLTTGMVLMISGSGTGFSINDQSTQQAASIQLTVRVDRVSMGRALVTVTSGTLNIGSATFTADGGRGIINFHSKKMVLHVSLKDSSGNTSHLVLFGKVNGQIPSTLAVNDHFSVDFIRPQSKLASKWFLEFPGTTVTVTSTS